jgi:hypothetical protein
VWEAVRLLNQVMDRAGESFREGFGKGFGKGFAVAAADSSPLPSLIQEQEQEQRSEKQRPVAAARVQGPDDAPRVLGKLAHCVLDDVAIGQVASADVYEELKVRAAKAGLQYGKDQLSKALSSADFQRRRKNGASGGFVRVGDFRS